MDKELLEAIGQMMEAQEKKLANMMEQQKGEILQAVDTKLAQQKAEITSEMQAVESRIMKGAAVLMDSEFTKHFKLLSEQQDAALSHAATDDDLDIMDGRIETLEKVVRKHSKEITELKKAN